MALVITSINGSEHPVLKAYAQFCQQKGIFFVLAGDRKTPGNFHLEHCEYLSIERQKTLGFTLATLLSENSYARKNIAYLQAIKNGCEIIIETDDDNLPLDKFWKSRNAQVEGDFIEGDGWLNAYTYFTKKEIWPRGYSLQHLDISPELRQSAAKKYSPVQQALADANPDVDAIIRLNGELPIYFEYREPLILGAGLTCPFNSQNTTWFKSAFALLYLPSTCSFRMCDIWRSFVALRIMQENQWFLSFHAASVVQERNEHNLLEDMYQELEGYVFNHLIIEELSKLKLKSGENFIHENMLTCYQCLVDFGWIREEEIPMLMAWLQDLDLLFGKKN